MRKFKKIKIELKRKLTSLKNKNYSFGQKVKYLSLMHWTYPKKIFLGILIIWLVGAILLYTPWAINYDSYTYVNNEYIFQLKVTPADTFMNLENSMKDYHYNFLKALFTSASAFTNTGLTVVTSIGTDLSFFGQFVVFVLIEVGGFGYASLFYLIGKSFRKITKKDLFSSSLLNIERGGTKISSSSAMIVRIFFIMLITQIVTSIIVSIYFYYTPLYVQENWSYFTSVNDIASIKFNNILISSKTDLKTIEKLLSLSFNNTSGVYAPTYHNFSSSFWYSLFLTSSGINNAGFDLFGSTSLQIFRNDSGVFIQMVILILVIIGGIGFPIIYDLSIYVDWLFKYKILLKLFNKKEYARLTKPRFSNFTKLCIFSYLLVGLFSIIFLFFTEYVGVTDPTLLNQNLSIKNYPNSAIVTLTDGRVINIDFWGKNSTFNKNFSIIFNILCCRSAGFSTVDFQNFTEPSIVLFSILMFIGTSPSSTGGGIRTTTLFVMFKSLVSWFRGVENTSIFKRKVPIKTIKNSYIVFLSAIIIVVVSTIIFYSTSSETIFGKNLVLDEYNSNSKLMDFSSFLFETSSAFGTSGNSFGISISSQIQWWNLCLLMMLMFIGQMGVSSFNLLFARRVPKKQESLYLEEDIRIG